MLILVIDWSLQVSALASEEHLLQFREHTSSLSDHSSDLNECVQMNLSQVSQFIFNWQILDSGVDFSVNLVVVRIHFTYQFKSNFIQDWQDQ